MSVRRPTILASLLAIVTLFVFWRTLWVPDLAQSVTEHSAGAGNKLQLQVELEKHVNVRKYGLNFQPNTRSRLPLESTLRQQLAYQFPYEPRKPFPKTIWQTWKVPISDAAFPPNYLKFQESWNERNPTYKHHVLPDEACHELINQLYSTVPDVKEAYNSMPKSILKADFFRYLILFARGGVYSDIDTVGLKPIDTWASANATIYGKPNHTGIVVGIEADPDRPDWSDWYARRIQFCQWTIQAKRGHPLLRQLIAHITDITLARKKNGQLSKVLGKDEGGDVMDWTGPGIWTDSVFEYMNNVVQPQQNLDLQQHEEIIGWQLLTGMTAPIVIDDVMVLPITSFSPGVNQMGAQSPRHPMAYVEHMFLGSWKPEDERM